MDFPDSYNLKVENSLASSTSEPETPSLHFVSQSLRETETVPFIQDSSNINLRIGTHWLRSF